MKMPEFVITPYTPERKRDWDEFVARSKNGTLLHLRDYMDYHADRFSDTSRIILRQGRIFALLPACTVGSSIRSHAGLTYGGLIVDSHATVAEVLAVFQLLTTRLAEEGYDELIYKPVPHIYHRLPAEEDLYALFRCGASLTARNVSATIDSHNRLKFRNIRRSGIRKALHDGVEIVESDDFARFWPLLTANLDEKYKAAPVHTLAEISLLALRFPDRIRLHLAVKGAEVLAGTVIYLSDTVAHTQYISASPEGKRDGALDLLFDRLINDVYASRRYFDFGTSNEDGGRYLNESLIYQKEGFGARAIAYDTWRIPLAHSADRHI